MEDKKKNSTYKVQDNTIIMRKYLVSFCEQVESNTLSPTIDDTDIKKNQVRVQKSATLSKRKAMLRRIRSTMILKGVKVQKSALVSKR